MPRVWCSGWSERVFIFSISGEQKKDGSKSNVYVKTSSAFTYIEKKQVSVFPEFI